MNRGAEMIPRHRPPFGMTRVALAAASCARPVSVEEVEQRFAAAYAAPHAVLVPSVRAGICWALQDEISPGDPVACPAYTCQVVHEAIVRAGAGLHFIDTADSGCLMDEAALEVASRAGEPLVLCEVFGHTYDLDRSAAGGGQQSPLRIVDMAMTVPQRGLVARLGLRDVGMLSFGIGKCVYSGWGGMCFTPSAELAGRIRSKRDVAVRAGDTWLPFRRLVQIAARTLAHHRWCYGWLRRVQERRLQKAGSANGRGPGDVIAAWKAGAGLSSEWFLPSSCMDRALMRWNVKFAPRNTQVRLALAARYRERLADANGVVLPQESTTPLSHYSVRVPAKDRPRLIQHLWRHGVDAGTLFGIGAYVPRDQCPKAARLSSEVVNLPLSPILRPATIDRISARLTEGLAENCHRRG